MVTIQSYTLQQEVVLFYELCEIVLKFYFYMYMNTDPSPPDDLRLAAVGINRLTFSWIPVLVTCPSIGYNITSMNCGVCPNFTLNTTVNCTVTTNHIHRRDQMCTFYVQSIVCGNYTGNESNTITIELIGKMYYKIIHYHVHAKLLYICSSWCS